MSKENYTKLDRIIKEVVVLPKDAEHKVERLQLIFTATIKNTNRKEESTKVESTALQLSRFEAQSLLESGTDAKLGYIISTGYVGECIDTGYLSLLATALKGAKVSLIEWETKAGEIIVNPVTAREENSDDVLTYDVITTRATALEFNSAVNNRVARLLNDSMLFEDSPAAWREKHGIIAPQINIEENFEAL